MPIGTAKADAHRDLARAHDGARRALRPVTRKEIAAGLVMLADAFSVDVPSDNAVELYAMALEDLSVHAYQQGLKALIKTHQWPKMPLPADILKHANPITQSLRTHLTRIERAKGEFARLA